MKSITYLLGLACLAFLLAKHGRHSLSQALRGRSLGINWSDCPPDQVLNSSGDCVQVTKLIEGPPSVAVKTTDSIDIYFQNDNDGAEASLTLLHAGVIVWSDKCAGPMCEITDSITNLTLDCNEVALVVKNANFSDFLSPSILNATFNNMTAVYETTVLSGIRSRDTQLIPIGTYDFSCPSNGTKTIENTLNDEDLSVYIHFTNDKVGVEATLSLLHEGVEVWSGNCTGPLCEVSAENITIDLLSCDDMSLLVKKQNESEFIHLSTLTVEINGTTVLQKTASDSMLHTYEPIPTGLFNLSCPYVQTAATPSSKTSANQTSVDVYFQNDNFGAEATLSLLHNGVEVWSGNCTGAACQVLAENITIDDLLSCDDMRLMLNKTNDTQFLSPSTLTVDVDGANVLHMNATITMLKIFKSIPTGLYNLICPKDPPKKKIAAPVNQTTSIEVYFQNDNMDSTATLILLNKGLEVWSDKCSGPVCAISADYATAPSSDEMLLCGDMSLLLHADSNATRFLLPSVLNATYNGLTVVDETTIANTRDLKWIDAGLHTFNCRGPTRPKL